jgi:hypothetical protein
MRTSLHQAGKRGRYPDRGTGRRRADGRKSQARTDTDLSGGGGIYARPVGIPATGLSQTMGIVARAGLSGH